MQTREKELQDIANLLRRDVLEITSEAGSGHPSSCMSCAEIISTLFFNEMSFDINDPDNPDNDEFVLSKGHAAPILYSVLYRAKCINNNIKSLRKLTSPLEGHPIPSSLIPWIKFASGSLGQGLSIGVGISLASKMKGRKCKTYVLLGDSETAEGSVYEALQLASHYKLNNLVAIIDVNRLGQTKETMLGHDLKAYSSRFESFGWETASINGHNVQQILSAFEKAKKSQKPFIILAKTIKGKGLNFIEDKNGWHGKALNENELKKALKLIPEREMSKIQIKSPIKTIIKEEKKLNLASTKYNIKEDTATRQAYGNALANLTKSDQKIIAIDAEVSNSTHSEEVKKKTPKQFIEAYIAEQNMIGMSLGLSKKGFNVFASTFAAFLTRAHDQLRMAAVSNPNLTICGSHSGVSIGEDGVSQMGLEDIAMFRSLPKSIILYPSDAISTEKLVYLAANTKGLKYIRTTRSKTPIIYQPTETFSLGEFKILRQSPNDKAVIMGAGITLHESLKAHDQLKNKNIQTSVIDLFCIKPLETRKLISFIKQHGNKLIITEDHYKEGGIGEMLISALADAEIQIKHLSINQIPHSGKIEELLDKYKINAKSIVEAVKSLI